LFAVCGCCGVGVLEVEVFVPQQPAVAKFVEELPLVAVGADQAGVQEEQDDAGSVVNDNNPVGSSLLAVIVFALGAILVLLCFLLLLLLLSLVADGVFHYCHINSTDRNTAIAYKRSRWMQGMARVVECWREGRTTSKGRLTIAMAFCAILVAREGSPRKDPSKTGTPPHGRNYVWRSLREDVWDVSCWATMTSWVRRRIVNYFKRLNAYLIHSKNSYMYTCMDTKV
jgi:hypothetical protein